MCITDINCDQSQYIKPISVFFSSSDNMSNHMSNHIHTKNLRKFWFKLRPADVMTFFFSPLDFGRKT